MNIAGLIKTDTIDFPHRLAAVVFVTGCNYDCGFCHNRHLLTETKLMDEKEVRGFLQKRAGMLDGIVLSGGEPTLQPDLPEFASWLKDLGYEVKLDTNGSRPAVVRELLSRGAVDYAAVDYKAPFARYSEICAASADGVAETMEILRASAAEWEMRTTVIPELSEDDLAGMAKAVEALPLWALQLYRPVRVERGRIYTPNEIEGMAQRLKEFQPNLITRC